MFPLFRSTYTGEQSVSFMKINRNKYSFDIYFGAKFFLHEDQQEQIQIPVGCHALAGCDENFNYQSPS
ncbi:hypothetical protein TNCV_56461 [Trichonephila clavipes]|nr:hypothetical protein TNCV_56461 [Trichonephila clavipes]